MAVEVQTAGNGERFRARTLHGCRVGVNTEVVRANRCGIIRAAVHPVDGVVLDGELRIGCALPQGRSIPVSAAIF